MSDTHCDMLRVTSRLDPQLTVLPLNPLRTDSHRLVRYGKPRINHVHINVSEQADDLIEAMGYLGRNGVVKLRHPIRRNHADNMMVRERKIPLVDEDEVVEPLSASALRWRKLLQLICISEPQRIYHRDGLSKVMMRRLEAAQAHKRHVDKLDEDDAADGDVLEGEHPR